MAASFTQHPYCAMCDANSSLLDFVSTSLVYAPLHLHFCAMSNTYSSLRRDFGTPLKAASLLLSAMCNAHSSLLRLIGTSPMATMFYSLHFSAMRDTYSSLSSGVFGTLLLDAFFSSPYA